MDVSTPLLLKDNDTSSLSVLLPFFLFSENEIARKLSELLPPFLESGVLNATDLLSSNSNPYAGSWSITDSNSNDDDNLADLDFNINFNVSNKLDDLSDDWDIISYTDTEIKLIDVSGGGGGTDYLTLSKQ